MPICIGVAWSISAAVSGNARLVTCAPNEVIVSEAQILRSPPTATGAEVAAKEALQLFHGRSSSSPAGSSWPRPIPRARMPRARARQSMRRERNGRSGSPRHTRRATRPGVKARCAGPMRRRLAGRERHRDANRGVVRSESGRHGIGSGMECEVGSILGKVPPPRNGNGPSRLAAVEVWHSCDASRYGAAARHRPGDVPYRFAGRAAAFDVQVGRTSTRARGTRASCSPHPRPHERVLDAPHAEVPRVVGVHELAHLALERGALGPAGRRLVCRYSSSYSAARNASSSTARCSSSRGAA